MPEYNPGKLEAWTGGRWTAAPAGPAGGFAIDTRELRAGEMFVALKTGRRDGHSFLGDAMAAGAAGALVSKADPSVPLPQLVVADPLAAFHSIARARRREFKGPVIGITGSAGKTSTKNLLAILLGGPPAVLATEGNLNNHLGVPLTLSKLDSAIHRFAVIEAGVSAPGEMAALAAMIEPDIAIVTLVAPAHLLGFGGVEGVSREKAALVAAVRRGGAAVFHRECLNFTAFKALSIPLADARHEVTQFPDSTEVSMSGAAFRLRRVSNGMARNAALALATALRLGIPAGLLRSRIAGWDPAPLRGEIRREDGKLIYLDCYNANPASMADSLEAFRSAAPAAEPRLYVIGCMEELGDEAEGFHRDLGRMLSLGAADFACIVGDHAAAVREGAIELGVSESQIAAPASLEAVSSRLACFRGAVFVKGSRRYQLEKLFGEVVHA